MVRPVSQIIFLIGLFSCCFSSFLTSQSTKGKWEGPCGLNKLLGITFHILQTCLTTPSFPQMKRKKERKILHFNIKTTKPFFHQKHCLLQWTDGQNAGVWSLYLVIHLFALCTRQRALWRYKVTHYNTDYPRWPQRHKRRGRCPVWERQERGPVRERGSFHGQGKDSVSTRWEWPLTNGLLNQAVKKKGPQL